MTAIQTLQSFTIFALIILTLFIIWFIFPYVEKKLKAKDNKINELKKECETIKSELNKRKFHKKDFMTPKERDFFFKNLVGSKIITSDFNVHPQVAMSAFIDTPLKEDRDCFDKKVVDFLVCDKKSRKIYCVIELDGTSHETSEVYDIERDKMLEYAGIPTLRYKNNDIPTPEKIRQDIVNLIRSL